MIYPRAEKWVQIDWAKVMLLESVIVYKKQNIDHFWPLYLLNLNFKMLYYKTFFSEFMEFQRIIWFILICLHFVMTQKSVHIKTTYYIIWSATLAVCSAQWCKLPNFCPFGFNISHFPTKLLSPNLYNHVYKSYILYVVNTIS